LAASSVAHAATITLDLTTAVFTGGASTIGGGSKIKFDPNTLGETATFTLASILGTQYVIEVTGRNNQSSSSSSFWLTQTGLVLAALRSWEAT
jgi:hypothetical protein